MFSVEVEIAAWEHRRNQSGPGISWKVLAVQESALVFFFDVKVTEHRVSGGRTAINQFFHPPFAVHLGARPAFT